MYLWTINDKAACSFPAESLSLTDHKVFQISLIFFHTDEYAYFIAQFGVHRTLAHIVLTVAEMVIFKILYLHKFSMIASMDEYFFTNFVTLINLLINFGLTMIKFSLGEHRRSNTYLHIFASPIEIYNPIPWPGP